MIRETQTVVRPVNDKDRNQLANLIHFGTYVHRHLDWRSPLGWIGHKPFSAVDVNNRLVAALACPPDPPNIAWLRVFVCSAPLSQTKAWKMLWPETEAQLRLMGVELLAAIPLQKWIRELLIDQGFEKSHDVITLSWDKQLPTISNSENIQIREMTPDDLPEVLAIDNTAFDPLWQNSSALVNLAFESAIFAHVALNSSGIVGYQISTATQYGIHLGRLAVNPNYQKQGIGLALIRRLQQSFSKILTGRISVNTQNTNDRSLALYHKAGFIETDEFFPVYQFTF